MSPSNFLCYRQAYRRHKAGKITDEEYFNNILQHLVWDHDCDDELDDTDAMGYVVLCVTSDCACDAHIISGGTREQLSRAGHLTTADTKPFEEIFLAYRQGLKDGSEAVLNTVPSGCQGGIRKALAYCALQEGDAQSLKWMLDGCWGQMGQAFEDQAYRVRKQRGADEKAAELWKIVEESRFEVPSEWKGRKSMHPPSQWDLW